MSCLFNSLGSLIKEDPYLLRQRICNYLSLDLSLNGEPVSKWLFNTSIYEYVKKMRACSTWGSSIELIAFCELYGYDVHVVNIRDRNLKNIEFINSRKTV